LKETFALPFHGKQILLDLKRIAHLLFLWKILVKNGNSGKGLSATLMASKEPRALQEERLTFGRKFNRSKKENKMNKKFILMWVGILLSLVLAACSSASSATSNFPTGKFVLPGTDESEGIYFNKDGTFAAFYYGADVAKGTYSVQGDLYTEETTDQKCEQSPMSFRYTFDGTNLKFELTDESKNDSCENRRQSFDGVTYMLVK
jgi:hypothetical protein